MDAATQVSGRGVELGVVRAAGAPTVPDRIWQQHGDLFGSLLFFAVLATTVVTTASAAGTRKQAIAIPPMLFGCYYCNAKKWA